MCLCHVGHLTLDLLYLGQGIFQGHPLGPEVAMWAGKGRVQ